MTAFEPALFRPEYLDGDTAGVHRAGPARIERHVGDQPLQLGLRHPVVERPLHMAPHLVGPVERGQHCHRDQAAVALAQVGMLPYIAEQHVVAELPQLGNELVHRRLLLSHVSISWCWVVMVMVDLKRARRMLRMPRRQGSAPARRLASPEKRPARPHRSGVTGWCDRRKARTWSIVFSSKSFGSRQGNPVDCAFGASAAMSTDVW